MSLRILQIMNRVPWPLKDGGALGYYNYTKAYHEAGCEVTVCAMNTSRHYVSMSELPPAMTRVAHWHSVAVDTSLKPAAAFLNLFSSRSYNLQRFCSPSFANLLNEVLAKQTFDVIVFESFFTTPYIEQVAAQSQALLVLRQHNVEHKIWETLAANEPSLMKRWYLRLLASRIRREEQAVLNCFDALTAVTQNDRQTLEAMGCSKPIFVSPFGIDLHTVSGTQAPDPYAVFHLGSMEWLPNVQAMKWFLREVWPVVIKQVPQARFYLAGRGMPDAFKKMQQPGVSVVGEVADAMTFMREKNIMVVPLFAGSGIRVKILEGMAAGKAIVSTPLGAAGIDCEPGRHLLLAENAPGFADALVHLLGNQAACRQMAREAAALAVEKYDNTKVIARVLNFYHKQLERKRSGTKEL